MRKFSKEVEQHLEDIKNRFSELSKLKEAVKDEPEFLDLGIGEKNQEITKSEKEALIKALEDNKNFGYTDNFDYGFNKAYQDYLLKEHSLKIKDEQIAYTLGIKSALNILATQFVSKGDYVIVLEPGYTVFKNNCLLRGAKIISLTLSAQNDFYPELKKISKRKLKKCKVMLINYPHNPSGKTLTKEEMKNIVNFAKKHHLTLINDAAYIDYCFKDKVSLFSFYQEYQNIIELFSLSKSHDLTGVRLGVILASKENIEVFKYLKDNYDSGQFLPLLKLGIEALKDESVIKKNQKRYEHYQEVLCETFKELGYQVITPTGGIFIYLKTPLRFDLYRFKNSFVFSKYLVNKLKIFVIPYDYQNEHYFRVSLTNAKPLKKQVEIIKKRHQGILIKY